MPAKTGQELFREIQACQACASFLPHPPRPILRFAADSRLLIIGQAPGSRVHDSGIPWQDRSGDLLREWLQLTPQQFYDENVVALVPMGFCYPGKGKNGDLPPRAECAPLWHSPVQSVLKKVRLTLLIGVYSQQYYLAEKCSSTLTGTVERFREFLPEICPLPHPSPRNGIWLKRNPWFAEQLLPTLRKHVGAALQE